MTTPIAAGAEIRSLTVSLAAGWFRLVGEADD
jgi:hypothetical protein